MSKERVSPCCEAEAWDLDCDDCDQQGCDDDGEECPTCEGQGYIDGWAECSTCSDKFEL
jgi:hypothetical protein